MGRRHGGDSGADKIVWKDVDWHIDWKFYFVRDFFDFNAGGIARIDGTVDLEGRFRVDRRRRLNSGAVAVVWHGPAILGSRFCSRQG